MSQTKPHPWRHPPPKPVPWLVYLAGLPRGESQNPRESLAKLRRQGQPPRSGGRAGWSAVWYISLTGWKKPAQFRMKVVSDVLLLSYLDKFGLRVTVEAGKALACLYSEARPGESFSVDCYTFYRQHLRVGTEGRPQQHTWNSEFFVLLPLKNNCCT